MRCNPRISEALLIYNLRKIDKCISFKWNGTVDEFSKTLLIILKIVCLLPSSLKGLNPYPYILNFCRSSPKTSFYSF